MQAFALDPEDVMVIITTPLALERLKAAQGQRMDGAAVLGLSWTPTQASNGVLLGMPVMVDEAAAIFESGWLTVPQRLYVAFREQLAAGLPLPGRSRPYRQVGDAVEASIPKPIEPPTASWPIGAKWSPRRSASSKVP